MGKLVVDSRGVLQGADFMESPNQDERPEGSEPEVLIIHCISLPPGEYGGNTVGEFFCNCLDEHAHPYYSEICELRVSAHFFVRRDGSVVQFVPTVARAWHAGESSCLGRTAVNDFSIGIELEGLDTDAYSDSQYDTLASLSGALFYRHPGLGPERIFGHSDIAPGRKLDPGPHFDWERYRANL